MQYRSFCVFCCGLLLFVSGAAISVESAGQSAGQKSEQAKVATGAAQVLHDEMNQPASKQIPRDLLDASRCIAVIPNRVKIGLIVGGSHGDGVVSCRTQNNDWSSPVFFELSSGSVGAQVGAKTTQYVFLFLDQNSVDRLLAGNFKFGADVDVIAGTLGAQADINTRPADVVVYQQKSKGLFAGAQIVGARFSINHEENEKLYGKKVDFRDILKGKQSTENNVSEINAYAQTLQKLAPSSQQKELGE